MVRIHAGEPRFLFNYLLLIGRRSVRMLYESSVVSDLMRRRRNSVPSWFISDLFVRNDLSVVQGGDDRDTT